MFSVPFPTSALKVIERIPICCKKRGESVTDQRRFPQVPFLVWESSLEIARKRWGRRNPEGIRQELWEETTWRGSHCSGESVARDAGCGTATAQPRQTRWRSPAPRTFPQARRRSGLRARTGLPRPSRGVRDPSAPRDAPRKRKPSPARPCPLAEGQAGTRLAASCGGASVMPLAGREAQARRPAVLLPCLLSGRSARHLRPAVKVRLSAALNAGRVS